MENSNVCQFHFFPLENMAIVDPFSLCRTFTVLFGAAKCWKSIKNKNDCQNSPLISQSHLELLEVKRLQKMFFFSCDTCKKKLPADAISTSFHLNFFKEKQVGISFLKMLFVLLQGKYMLDNVPSYTVVFFFLLVLSLKWMWW